MNPRVIPNELKQYPNWVVWKLERRNGDTTKVPYQVSGAYAKSNEPATWCDFATAVKAHARGDFDGVGFVFTESPFVGIDLDKCRQSDVQDVYRLAAWAQWIVDRVDSYAEISPSGSGVHIIVAGTLPPGRRRYRRVEMYESGRFFTMTGTHLAGTPQAVTERTDALAYIHRKIFPQHTKQAQPATPRTPNNLHDRELLRRAMDADNGAKFLRLWRGTWRGAYESHSEADEALCCMLAFWTGNDESRIDAMFRHSQLFREKWDRRATGADNGGMTYGELTVRRAVELTNEVYTPNGREPA